MKLRWWQQSRETLSCQFSSPPDSTATGSTSSSPSCYLHQESIFILILFSSCSPVYLWLRALYPLTSPSSCRGTSWRLTASGVMGWWEERTLLNYFRHLMGCRTALRWRLTTLRLHSVSISAASGWGWACGASATRRYVVNIPAGVGKCNSVPFTTCINNTHCHSFSPLTSLMHPGDTSCILVAIHTCVKRSKRCIIFDTL